MKDIDAACIRVTRDPLISLREKKSVFLFCNTDRKEITCIQVDGCAIKEGVKCDHLVIDDASEYFVELKGCDVKHAIDQLEATIKQLSLDPIQGKKYAFIVSTRCPMTGADIQQLKKQFKIRFNAELIIKNSPLKFSL